MSDLEKGSCIDNGEIITVEADYATRAEKSLIIWLTEADKYQIEDFLLLGEGGIILDICPAEVSENDSKGISFNFENRIDFIKENAKYTIAARIVEKATLQHYTAVFTCNRITEKKKSENEAFYQCASYLKPVFTGGLAVLCYQDKREVLMMSVCRSDKAMHSQMQAKLINIKSGRSDVRIYAVMKKNPELSIKEVVFRYRSLLSYALPLEYKVREKAGYYYFEIYIDFKKLRLRELYWDVHIVMTDGKRDYNLQIKFSNLYWKCRFYLTNKDYKAGKGHIIFPYYTVGNCLAFLYRASSAYDGYATKLKEIIASGIYYLTRPFVKEKNIWLVFEKFSTMAQDNGYYFFKYCMENLPKKERKHIYYVIDKKSSDYGRVKKYKGQVIPFMSIRHCLYVMRASLYVGSDAKNHLFAWRSKTSFVHSRMASKPVFFLQHGVTALKDVSKIFGKSGSSPMTYFAVTSRFEQDIVVNYLHYDREKVPITGFTRWDVLEDTKSPEEKIVLMMPTWRSWLEEVSDEEFLKSDYYVKYSRLLKSEGLLSILKKHGVKMIFYIHPKFADYQKNFTVSGDYIKLVPFGSEPLNEIIKKCHMLITDYSSVCWDVYYQKKPVVFYQFDYDKYSVAHGSFIDMKTELFGRRTEDETELIELVEECIKDGFRLLQKDEEKHGYYFEYIDDNNSKRTYEYLSGLGKLP